MREAALSFKQTLERRFRELAESTQAVGAFYEAALAAGGRDNGPPGPREHYGPDYYGGFVLDPDHPNVAAPGKRPRHTIIPGFLTRGGEAVGPFGVMGGEMQPQGHLQVVNAMIDHGLNPQAALDTPRWRVERDHSVIVEEQVPEATVAGLRARGHEVTVEPNRMQFGRGQIILRTDDGVYVAGSEPRADGCAVGL